MAACRATGAGWSGPGRATLIARRGGTADDATAFVGAQGRPDTEGAANLAPAVPPPIATAADKLPVAKLKLPKNFNIEVYASGMPDARSLRIDDIGTVFVSNQVLDKIYAIVDKNGKREVKTLATGLYRPNGIALHNGTLYIAELNKISKIDDIEDHLDNTAKPTVIYSDLPSDEPHGWKFLAVGPDNRLYFNVGAPCNICMPSPAHAQLRSINLDGSDTEVVAHGIRQVVGMDFHPVSKVLYFTENQRDWLSEDEPQDKLNRVLHPGKDNFGFPYCDGGDIEDPISGEPGGTLARRAAFAIHIDPARHVPRGAARRRADEYDDQGVERRRSARGGGLHRHLATPEAASRSRRPGPPRAGTRPYRPEPLQCLPPPRFLRPAECAATG